MKDLVGLVPDRDAECAVRHLLKRGPSLGIRPVQADIFPHVRHDPGVLNEAANFLAPFLKQYSHALGVFDREGCGRQNMSARDLEDAVQRQLDLVGWKGRSGVVVIDPELEVWVWSDSPHVGEVLGMRQQELQQLVQGHTVPGAHKPSRPKELMEEVLRRSRIPRSSSLYAELAEKVGLERCTDGAFQRLKDHLKMWFPIKASGENP